MINFSWKYVTYESGNTFIDWTAVWDGNWENDPLYREHDLKYHPFRDTGVYEQCSFTYNRLKPMTPEERNKPFEFTVRNDDGTEYLSSFPVSWTEEEVDAENPELLREAGDIVACNPVTVALCEMLSDPKKILEGHGNTSALNYRDNLIAMLDSLWD